MAAALITGASSGIGAATAKLFAQKNYDLILVARNEQRLRDIEKQCLDLNPKIRVVSVVLDLKNYVSSKIHSALLQISPVEILVNNAGIFERASTTQSTDQIWEDQFQTNLMGSVKITRDLWPIFEKNKKGSIVNVSSILGIKPAPGTSAYSAIKAAMINWTLCLAQEGGAANIRANCLCPGIVDTPIHSFYNLPSDQKNKTINQYAQFQLLDQIGNPEQVAEAIYFLASDKSSWTTGSVLSIDGGINIK